jgi:hypothetical protein
VVVPLGLTPVPGVFVPVRLLNRLELPSLPIREHGVRGHKWS